MLVLTLGCFITNFFVPGIARWLGLSAGIVLLLLVAGVLSIRNKFKAFNQNGYGLNEGKVFHQWINKIISSNCVEADPAKGPISNMGNFAQHFMRVPPGLKVRPDDRRGNNNPPNMPMLTIVTCDIVSECKIEFPNMWDLYWSRQEDVHPGDFVRASMSIPVFFETYCLTDIRKRSTYV